MERQCSKCGAELQAPWKFCPLCGGTAAAPLPAHAAPAEKSPARGAFGGLVFGILAVPILVIVGGLLCLTGLGAILGIPMIVAAVFAPLLGPLVGMKAHTGRCPYCGTAVSDIGTNERRECPVCDRVFSAEDAKGVKAA